MCKIGSPLLSFLLSSLCTPLQAFHKQYADMYDKFVRIYLKDGSMRIGLFNDEFYEDTSILVSCEVIKITDIEKMELFEEQP